LAHPVGKQLAVCAGLWQFAADKSSVPVCIALLELDLEPVDLDLLDLTASPFFVVRC